MNFRRDTAYVTWGIVAINVIYFLYLDLTGSSLDALHMLLHGSLYAPLVLEGEYYRLVTAVFMHYGISHLVNNMLVLLVLGEYMERALGRIKFAVFYLLCGIGANVVYVGYYLYLKEREGILTFPATVGASGAIFGVAGGLLYVVLVNRGRLENLSTSRMAIMIILSLYMGFQSAQTNNLAHIAGVIIGFFLAIILYRRPHNRNYNRYFKPL